MAIESDIVNYLLAQSEITDVVSERVYPTQLPENSELPALMYIRIGGNRMRTHRGHSQSATSLQISCWSKSYGEAKYLSDMLIEKLDNYDGYMQSGRVTIFHQNDRDIYEPDTGLYHIPVDFEIHYE